MSDEVSFLDFAKLAGEVVQQYAVGFAAFDSDAPHLPARSAGSGTLVDFDGIKGVLTAAHVASALQGMIEFGIVRFRKGSIESLVCRGPIEVVSIGGEGMGEAGPDIAFIRLPPTIEVTLAATNVFFSALARGNALADGATFPPDFMRFVIGVLGESTRAAPPSGNLYGTEFTSIIGFGELNDYRRHEHTDTFRFSVEHRENFLRPKSYAGLSGGGVWQIAMADGPMSRALGGVVFRETAVGENGERELICHGAETIYGALWQAVSARFLPYG